MEIGGKLLVGIVVNRYAIYYGLYAFAIHFPSLEWHGLSHGEEVLRVNLVASIQIEARIRIGIIQTDDTRRISGHELHQSLHGDDTRFYEMGVHQWECRF